MIIYVAIYWLSIRAYALAIHIAAWFNPKAKLFIKGRQGLFTLMQDTLKHESRPRVWMHCASLGEFEQGRPVLERFRKEYPAYAFVLTFFSPSGYEVRKNYEGADYIFYLPLDSLFNAKRFLCIVDPSLCVFVKYELWYFYLSRIRTKGIPAISISAFFRKEQVFFSWYGHLQRYMLRCFSHIFVQDNESARLLSSIKVNNVSVTGDTRFDRVIELAKNKTDLPLATAFAKNNKIIIAGSTWQEDEVFLFKILPLLASGWKLIIVPHEVDINHINEIEALFKGLFVKWSEWKEGANAKVLIVDKVGFLSKIYRYADVAWIGGAFGKEGVHNVLEAAVYGVPCAYGPVFHQFIEAKELIEAGGAISTQTPSAFADQVKKWENDPGLYKQASVAAKKYVQSKAGATDKITDYMLSQKILM